MTASQIRYYYEVNQVDPDRVAAIEASIRQNGWQGAPILVLESMGMLITGSHRLAAIKALASDLNFDLDSLGDVAEAVDDIVCAYCEENGCTVDDLPYDNLSAIFAGTWVEEYKDQLSEW